MMGTKPILACRILQGNQSQLCSVVQKSSFDIVVETNLQLGFYRIVLKADPFQQTFFIIGRTPQHS